MDPTVILKLVREQRRQINDSFSSQQKQLASPNSTSSSSNSSSPNHSFQAPPTPPRSIPLTQTTTIKQAHNFNETDM